MYSLEIILDTHPFTGYIHTAINPTTRRKGYINTSSPTIIIFILLVERKSREIILQHSLAVFTNDSSIFRWRSHERWSGRYVFESGRGVRGRAKKMHWSRRGGIAIIWWCGEVCLGWSGETA